MRRLPELPNEEWVRAVLYPWADGTPMTVASLIAYGYHGATHDGGHAQELERLHTPATVMAP
jgi:hypothetical protein